MDRVGPWSSVTRRSLWYSPEEWPRRPTEWERKFRSGRREWGARSLEQAMQIQSDYAKRVYENHMAELKKLGEMCVGMVRDTTKPVEDASRKFR
jgi:hypothetical protein